MAASSKGVIALFHELSFSHIFREQNVQADVLSRLALQENVDFIYFEIWSEVVLVASRDRLDSFD